MRRFRQQSAIVLVAFLLVGLPAQARKLKVGISGSPPFVIQENNSFQGISLDVWRQVAEDNGLVYDLVPQSSPEVGIAAVDQGQIDVLVGPISINPPQIGHARGRFHSALLPRQVRGRTPPRFTHDLQPREVVLRLGRDLFDVDSHRRLAGGGQFDLARRTSGE